MKDEKNLQKADASLQYHTHISSKKRLLSLNLGEVWRYRDLIVLFTRRSFVLTYKQTVLGPAWIFLTPIITSLIYSFVFGGIAGISTDGVPTLLFYLASNAIWTYFATCVTQNASTFTANAHVFGKVYFPRLTMPISNMLATVIQFLVQMILVVVLLGYYVAIGAVSPNWWGLLLIPAVLLQLGVLGLGVGIIISSLTTKYRDLAILVTFGVQLWMYATPVVYPMSQLAPGFMRTVLSANPVTASVELFRWALLGEGTILPLAIGVSAVLTVVVALVGIMIFNRVEKTFMDTV